MDDQNNKTVNRGADAPDSKPTGGEHRNRRHHHRSKKNRHPDGAAPAQNKQNQQASENNNAASKNKDAQKQQKHDGQKHQKHDGQKHQKPDGQKQQQHNAQGHPAGERDGSAKSGGGRNKNRGHGKNRNNRPSGEKRPYDPYEEPIAEELSLAELRARIVLQSGSADDQPAAEPASNDSEPRESIPATDGPIPIPSSLLESEPEKESEPVEKVEIIGIRFRSSGKMYYFDPKGIRAKKGDCAIVETARGPEFGDVCLGNSMVRKQEIVSQLRPLIRLATEEDIAHNQENCKKEKEALSICQQKILAHKLEMKLIDAQYAFDNSKLLFYFSAEGRVDFRELVRDLASVFRTRIELRQIGIRDEAKLLGGIGACGRPLCCSTFLPDFAQVSIKMAKEQNLSLNSSKISGVCGRLMCCLRYESDVYAEEIRRTPANDATVKTADGIGRVISSNPLAGTIRVLLRDDPDAPPKQYHRDEVTVLEKEKRKPQERKNDRAEKAGKAERVEKNEKQENAGKAEAVEATEGNSTEE